MEDFKTSKIDIPTSRLCSIFCSTGVPVLVNFVAVKWLYNPKCEADYDSFLIGVAVIGFFISLLFTMVLHNVLPRFKCFRTFKKYEGRWLQIIPESKQRPVSVINFNYRKDLKEYEMYGINFTNNFETGIEFISHKFIKRDHHDGFYYITNHTWEQKNGLGKVGFMRGNLDGLIRAEGYFFDASNQNCSKKYNTIMIKCDEAFYNLINPLSCKSDFDKLTEREIAKLSINFVEKEIRNYKATHKIALCQKALYK